MSRKLQIFLLSNLVIFTALWGGDLRVNLINGTSNTPGYADRVALIDLAAGMAEVAAVTDVSKATTFSDIHSGSQSQYLIQASLNGTKYTSTFVPAPGLTAWETSITLYDVSDQPTNIEATVPFFVIYAFEDKFYIQKRLVLENHSDPPMTFIGAPGVIKVYIPENVIKLDYLTFKDGNMPINTQSIETESGQLIPNALKPGNTEIDIAYYLPYEPSGTEILEEVGYGVEHFHVYTMPIDIKVTATGLNREGTDHENGVAIYSIDRVAAGTELKFLVSGKGMADTQGQSQQNTGNIVVEHRLPISNIFILSGILILLILGALFISIVRQHTDLKKDSVDLLKQQKKDLLADYNQAADSTTDGRVKEKLLQQLIAVYKTLERIK